MESSEGVAGIVFAVFGCAASLYLLWSQNKWVRRIVSGEAGQPTPGKYVAVLVNCIIGLLYGMVMGYKPVIGINALGVLIHAYYTFLIIRASEDRLRASRSLVLVLVLVGIYAATVFAVVPASTTNAPDRSNGRMVAFGVAGIASSITVHVVAFMHVQELEACASVAIVCSWSIYGLIHRDQFIPLIHILGLFFLLCQVSLRDDPTGNVGRRSTLSRHIRYMRGLHDPDF